MVERHTETERWGELVSLPQSVFLWFCCFESAAGVHPAACLPLHFSKCIYTTVARQASLVAKAPPRLTMMEYKNKIKPHYWPCFTIKDAHSPGLQLRVGQSMIPTNKLGSVSMVAFEVFSCSFIGFFKGSDWNTEDNVHLTFTYVFKEQHRTLSHSHNDCFEFKSHGGQTTFTTANKAATSTQFE